MAKAPPFRVGTRRKTVLLEALDGIKKLFEGIGAALGAPGKVLSGDPSEVIHAISAISEGVQEIAAVGRGARSN